MFSSTILASLVALVPTFVHAAAAGCSRSYTVKAGDFCDSISAANNASTYQLATVNSDAINTGCSNLSVGQSLCLGTTGADCQATYVVQSGDFCSTIMSKFNINGTLLYSNNPQINAECSNIYTGEVLCVGGSVAVPPPPASGQVTIVPPAPAATPVVASSSAAPAATTAAPVNVAPAPTASDDGADDDEGDDCDEDDASSAPAPASSAPAPASSAPAPASSAPAPATSAPAPATTAAPVNVAPAPTSTDDGSDDDLPFCDEL